MNQVTYLMSGQAHLPYLVASVYTLRKYWSGTIAIYAWPESFDLVRKIACDGRLGCSYYPRTPKYRKKDGVGSNSQFIDKIALAQELHCDISMYLDADTTVHGLIDRLFESAEHYGFVATQWNNWTTERGHAHRRVSELRDIEGIPNNLIDQVTSKRWPSVNGGVWAAWPCSDVLPRWHEWTLKCSKLFIADERVLHLMMVNFVSQHLMTVMTDNGRWNCSPKFQPEDLPDEDVIIRHYHGDSNVRPDKSQRGWDLWRPIFQECLELNIGGMADWHKDIGNKWLKKLEGTY